VVDLEPDSSHVGQLGLRRLLTGLALYVTNMPKKTAAMVPHADEAVGAAPRQAVEANSETSKLFAKETDGKAC
jgi:hypothetical protein